MITKDTTTTVNFFVTDTNGLPATGQASNITATISINGATATAISDTITEKGSGWYYFNHLFGTAGNVFITFAATGCVIMPWEDDVVEISASSAPSASTIASAVWNWTVTGIPSQNSMYSKVNTLPGSVWSNSTRSLTSEVLSADKSLATNVSASAIATAVWSDTTNYSGTTTKGYLQANGSGVWSQVASHDSISGIDTTYGDVLKSRSSSADIASAQNAIISAMPDVSGLSTFDPSNDTVTINATQAATMATATGFATPTNVTDAVSALETYGDAHWTGGGSGSGITAEDVWKYSGTYGRTLTESPTDISSLATSANVTAAQANIIAAMPDITGLSTFNASTDAVTINSTQAATMVTATGFATPSDIPTADITAIKTKVDTLHNTDLTGIATSANVTASQNAVIAAMPTIPTDYAKASDLTGLSTFNAATDAVTINSTQAATMITATGFATPANITTAQAAIIAHGDENWVGGGEGGGATPKQIWEYADRTLTAAPSTLATKTDLTTAVSGLSTFNAATDKVTIKASQLEDIASDVWAHTLYLQNVGYTAGTILAGTMGLSDAILDATDTITTYGDNHWTTAIIPTDDITHIKNKVDTLHNTDLTGIATSTDITAAQTSIEAAIANIDVDTSDLAKSSEVAVLAELQKDLNAGVLNWSVTANALTIYNDNNTVRGTYTLTRDTDGNITRILPNS